MGLLKDPYKNWQPQDFLPDPESPDFLDEVAAVQKRGASLPDDHLVVLVGDMITEEALPTYMNMLNTLETNSTWSLDYKTSQLGNQIKRQISKADKDKNGYLDKEEFADLVERLQLASATCQVLPKTTIKV